MPPSYLPCFYLSESWTAECGNFWFLESQQVKLSVFISQEIMQMVVVFFFLNLCLALFKFAATGFCLKSQVKKNPDTLGKISEKPLNFTCLCKEILWNHEFSTLPVWNPVLTQSFFYLRSSEGSQPLGNIFLNFGLFSKFVIKLRILSVIGGVCNKSRAQL